MKHTVMNQTQSASASAKFRPFPRFIHFRLVITRLKLLQAVSYTPFLNVNRKVVFIPGLSAYRKGFCFALCFGFCVFFGSHSESSYAADGSTKHAIVNELVKRKPHAVRRADFRCPDFTAMQVPPNTPHEGSYVRCEDWDTYHTLMTKGDEAAAGKLLLQEAK